LVPGEKFYTVLFEEGGRLVRQDYSSSAWRGAPHGAFSFWSGTVPPPNEENRPRIDDDLLMDCFQRLQAHQEPDRQRFRYVVALLLMRRKRLRFEGTRMINGDEQLLLRDMRTRADYEVLNPRIPEHELASVQERVLQAIGWE
jgi:hypothetical protein